jgi:hypothetical protein
MDNKIIQRGEKFWLGHQSMGSEVEYVGIWNDGAVLRYLNSDNREDHCTILNNEELREYGLTIGQDKKLNNGWGGTCWLERTH